MIVLFDIDGTLTTGSRCGSASLEAALFELFGLERALDGVTVHGNIDPLIVRQATEARGLWPGDPGEQAALVARVLERYRAIFEERVGAMPYRPLAAAEACVREAQRACEIAGLATGNIRACAHGKLRSAGLGGLFEGCVGGYGDDAPTRVAVVAVAIERARAKGARGEALVVGDTPSDVSAGLGAGAKVAAVATGKYSVETLRDAGATAVYEDLRALMADPPWG